MVAVGSRQVGFRQDGFEKVTGSGRYGADLTHTGQLHGRFKFAGVAHARIKKLDLTRARSLPGVIAVISHGDVPDVRYGAFVKDRTLFASEVVRWEGEVVAAVAAVTPEIAAQAIELIELDLEPLPVVIDLEQALEPGSPLVHPDWAGYEADENAERQQNEASRSSIVKGDAAADMARADVVIKGRYVTDGCQPAPIEPRAITAEWRGDSVTVWSTSQVPYAARTLLAETLEMPENAVRVIVPHLGGGFGAKCEGHFEPQVAALARAAGRPVKLVFTRREEFLAPDKRRERMIIELESGAMRDGTVIARRGRVLVENGAYSADEPFLTQLAAMFGAGPYRLDSVDVTGYCIYTNTQPSGSVRAPTAPNVAWALEQHLDELALELGIDALELRRKNLLRDGDEGPTGQRLESANAIETLERAAELIGYGTALPDDEAIGFASCWWPSFPASSGAFVKINADGSPTIVTGAQECGTGAVMSLPILAGEVLGIDPGEFSILYQDTEAGPVDTGASGSQTLFNNGRAVMAAATEVREQLLELASEELEAARWDLELVDGVARVKGTRSPFVTIARLAEKAHEGRQLLGSGSGDPPPKPEANAAACIGRLGGEVFAAPSFATHAVRVRVDRETGVVRVLRVAAVHDAGTIINEVGANGQVTGGVVMGIGQALSESIQLGSDGLVRNADLLEYKLQTSADAPPIDIAFVDRPAADAGPKGSRGLGEPPCIPTPGAIANAIARATSARVKELPATPERVWAAMHENDASEAGR
jgi:CO/xanthine dehydrogenase Mo-binding subunit